MSRNYLEAFVIIVVSAAFGFFLVWPQYQELRDLTQRIEDKNVEVENRIEYYADLGQINAGLGQYEANLRRVESAFPSKDDASALMNFVQAAAMQSGLILKGVNYYGLGDSGALTGAAPAKPVSSKKNAALFTLRNYSISATISGSYANFKSFLSRVEHSSRLVAVNVINVSSLKQANTGKGETAKTAGKNKAPEEQPEPVLDFTVKLSANFY